MNTIKEKLKKNPCMRLISDNGYTAKVLTTKYHDYKMEYVTAVLIFVNDTGDGKYSNPVDAIYGDVLDNLIKAVNDVKDITYRERLGLNRRAK